MANLETLELTINGNASKASQGITGLIGSLNSLSGALTKPLEGLSSLNKELVKLKSFGGIKLPNISKMTGAAAASSKMKKAVSEYDPLTNNNRIAVNKGSPSAVPDDVWKKNFEANLAEERAKHEASRIQNEARRAELAAEREAKAIAKAAEETKELGKDSSGTSESLKSLKQGLSNMTSGVSKFFGRVKRIATTMLIRSAIRALIKDIKEGVNNLYEWSKLNNGAFAKSLDTLKNKAGTLKNSIGAAIAPVIQAAIPVINSLASAAIYAFNCVNQLLALLTGQGSWTKATEGVHDYADAVNGAGGSAKKWLATFDELNVMTSEGGGGGGGKQIDYSDMFEEMTQFDEGIRNFADFLKNNISDIKAMALEIGTAILGWKISQAFADVLPSLAKIAGLIGVGATIALTITATWLLTNEYLNTGEPGWLIADVFTTAVGATAAWAIANKIMGGQAGAYTAAVALTFSALTGIVAVLADTDVGAFSAESITTLIVNALKAGLAVGILLKTVGGASMLTAAAGAGAAALAIFGVSIGLKAALDPNVELFSAANIASTIGAAVATGLGTLLFVGSAPAAGIVAAATFFTLVALKLTTTKDHIAWGNFSMTKEQIDSYVRDVMFETDPNIIVNIIAQNVEAGRVERDKIRNNLTEMLGTLEMIRLGIDMNESAALLQKQMNDLVNNIHDYVLQAQETGKLTLQFTPTLVGETAEEQAAWFTGYEAGWSIVEDFYKTKGKEIGELFVENEKGQIEVKNPELLQTIMSSINEITNAIAESDIVSDALSKMKIGLGDMTEATGTQVVEVFKQYKQDLESAYSDLVAEQYRKQGELVAALGKIDPNSAEYKEAVEEYEKMGKNMVQAVQDGVESKIQPGKDIVMEWLNSSISISNTSGMDYWLNAFEKRGFTAEGLQSAVSRLFEDNHIDPVAIEAMELVNVTAWDFLSDDIKRKFISAVKIDNNTIKEAQKAGIPASDLFKFSDWGNLTTETRKSLVTAITNAYGTTEAISAIKKLIPNISAGGFISLTNWETFSKDQQLSFVTAIKDAFGAEAAKTAAKNAGINIGDLVKNGMNSKNADIKKQAESWSGIIDTGVKKTTPVVTPKLKDGIAGTFSSTLKKGIEGTAAVMSNVTAKFKSGNPGNLKTEVEKNVKPTVSVQGTVAKTEYGTVKKQFESNVKPSVSIGATILAKTMTFVKDTFEDKASPNLKVDAGVKAGVTTKLKENVEKNTNPNIVAGCSLKKDTYGNLQRNIEALTKPNIKATVSVTNIDTIASNLASIVRKAFSGTISVASDKGKSLGSAKMTMKASGGFVDSGDLFIANENGVPEMIGRFGNQTAVANTDQIVAGISKGVADANSEQNALLREQNSLLRGILAKDSSGGLSASSGLGRTVKQSLDMYAALVGG